MERKSKKSLEELYSDELSQNPYKEVDLAEMSEALDPEAMAKAVAKQKKTRGYFDRLKSKLERN